MDFFLLSKLWARWFHGGRNISCLHRMGASAAAGPVAAAGSVGGVPGTVDFLALTPLGCRMLAGQAVTAAVLLLPGDCGANGFRAETVVTYGLSPRDSITFSSLREPVLCVQRALPLLRGGVLEPQEFPLPGLAGAEGLLPCVSARLLWTGSPYPP